jgi:hypothetical protein
MPIPKKADDGFDTSALKAPIALRVRVAISAVGVENEPA